MAETTLNLKFQVKGQADLKKLEQRVMALEKEVAKLTKQLPRAENNIRNTGKAAATATGNIQRMGIAFRSTIAPVVTLFGAINFLNKSLQTLSTREADAALLEQGLKRLGESDAFASLQKQANDFGNATLFNQEDFTQASGILTSFTDIAVKDYGRLIKVASDVAQTNNTGVKDSVIQLAKALNAPKQNLSALSRSGIQFTEKQKDLIKVLVDTGNKAKAQEIILRELEKQYGGNAVAAATGLAGAQDSLGESFRDFQEVVAKGVLPIVETLVKQLTSVFQTLATLDPKVVESATKAVLFAGKIFLVSKALKGIIALRAGIAATLAATSTGLKAAGGAAAFANPKLVLAKNTLLSLARIGIITVGVDIIINGLGKLAEVEARLKKFSAEGQGTEGFASAVGGSALSKAEIQKLLDENAAETKRRQEELASVRFPALTAQDDIARAALLQLETRAAKLRSMLEKATYNTAAEREKADMARLLEGVDLDTGNGKKKTGGAGKTPKDDTDRATEMLRKQEQQFRLLQAQEGLERDLLSITQDRADEFERINALQGVSADIIETLQANASLLADNRQLDLIEEFGKNALANAKELVDETNLQIAADNRRLALIEDGMNPALASQIVQIEQQFNLKEKQLDLDIKQLETALLMVDAESAKADEIRNQIALLEQYKQKLGLTEGNAIENARRNNPDEPGKIQQYMDQLAEDLADTEGMIVSLAQTVETEIGNAMANAITGLIEGTKTAQESFSEMFKNIGSAFVQMASEMIAKALVMKALGILTGGGTSPVPVPIDVGAEAIGRASFSGGGYTGDGPRVGGLDGQGGFPAILHPQETVIDHRGSSVDHRSAMQRYGSGGGSVNVNYTGPTMTFNEVDYVPKSAVPDIIRAAAKEGAAGGHARSMSTLKNSRSQRSKLGMR